MGAKHDWIPFYVSLILLVILAAVFTFAYFQLTARITDNNNSVTELQGKLALVQSDLSAADSRLISLTSQLSGLTETLVNNDSKFVSIDTQLSSAKTQLTQYSQDLENINAQITDLKGQNTTSGSQITTLQTQLDAMKSQLASALNTITTLQNQVAAQQSTINSLSQAIAYSTALFSRTISQAPGTNTLVYTFTPSYSGLLVINGTSNTVTAYILVVNNTNGTSSTYNFGTGTTVYAQLIANNNYSVYFGNRNTAGTITATLNGVYQPY